MYYALQMLIVAGVICANIYWQLTPNPYLAALIGGAAAYVATYFIGQAVLKGRQRRAEQEELAARQQYADRA